LGRYCLKKDKVFFGFLAVFVLLIVVGVYVLVNQPYNVAVSFVYPSDCIHCKETTDLFLDILKGTQVKYISEVYDVNTTFTRDLENRFNIEVYPAIFVESDENLFSEVFTKVDDKTYAIYSIASYYKIMFDTNGVFHPNYFVNSKKDNFADGKISVVMFGDYLDPYSAESYFNIYSALRENYIDTNKIQFTFVPVFNNMYSFELSKYAACADLQHMVLEYTNNIYANTKPMGLELLSVPRDELTNELGDQIYKKYFDYNQIVLMNESAGIDLQKFKICLDTNEYSGIMENYLNIINNKFLIFTTPSFLIGNEIYYGFVDKDLFVKDLDLILGKYR